MAIDLKQRTVTYWTAVRVDEDLQAPLPLKPFAASVKEGEVSERRLT